MRARAAASIGVRRVVWRYWNRGRVTIAKGQTTRLTPTSGAGRRASVRAGRAVSSERLAAAESLPAIHPLPARFLLHPDEPLPLLRAEDLRHVEEHEDPRLLELGARVLDLFDPRRDRLAVRVHLDGVFELSLPLLEVRFPVDESRPRLREDRLDLPRLFRRQAGRRGDPRTLPPLPFREPGRGGGRGGEG